LASAEAVPALKANGMELTPALAKYAGVIVYVCARYAALSATPGLRRKIGGEIDRACDIADSALRRLTFPHSSRAG
jgi:hypothetical protein